MKPSRRQLLARTCSISRVLFSQHVLDACCALGSVLVAQNLEMNFTDPLAPWSAPSHRETAIDCVM